MVVCSRWASHRTGEVGPVLLNPSARNPNKTEKYRETEGGSPCCAKTVSVSVLMNSLFHVSPLDTTPNEECAGHKVSAMLQRSEFSEELENNYTA